MPELPKIYVIGLNLTVGYENTDNTYIVKNADRVEAALYYVYQFIRSDNY